MVNLGLALIDKQLIDKYGDCDDSEEYKNIEISDEIKSVYKTVQKFIDINDDKVKYFFFKFKIYFQNINRLKASKFVLKLFSHLGLYGKALKILFKQLEEKCGTKSADQSVLNVIILLIEKSMF